MGECTPMNMIDINDAGFCNGYAHARARSRKHLRKIPDSHQKTISLIKLVRR